MPPAKEQVKDRVGAWFRAGGGKECPEPGSDRSHSTDYREGGKNWMDFVTVLVSLVCSSGVNAKNFIPAF